MIKYHAHFEFDEVAIIEREESDIRDDQKECFFNTKSEALASLAASNWKEYDILQAEFDITANTILSRKDKIYKKIVEVFKEKE
jgi:hypothetical protein